MLLFFNEGLVKRFLMNLYSGKSAENKRILNRNSPQPNNPDQDENTIKKDTDDETILETIWFCKVLLIFAIGEMYLGTESSTHAKRQKLENMKRAGKERPENMHYPDLLSSTKHQSYLLDCLLLVLLTTSLKMEVLRLCFCMLSTYK